MPRNIAARAIRWRCGSLVALLLVGGCSAERSEGDPFKVLDLTLSEPAAGRPERRLTFSVALPDTVFGRIVHLDLHADGLSVVDALGKFTAVLSYDLDMLQVVGRSGQGPGELVRPVASRVDGGRILVMDQATRRISAFGRDRGDGGRRPHGLFDGIVVDLRRGGDASMGTDFAVRGSGEVVIPVHKGATYLTAVRQSDGEITAAGPRNRDETSEQQLRRLFDRVSAVGDGSLLVWDDDEAMLILTANDDEARWRLPDPYRGTVEPRASRAPDGSGVAISVGAPRIEGWTAERGSVCLVIRPFGAREADLLWLEWDGEIDSPPLLRRIVPEQFIGEPVSCGVAAGRLFVVTRTDILRVVLHPAAG